MPPESSPALILLVDDVTAVRKVIEKILIHLGYRVVACEDVQSALDAMRVQAPDLVVTDVFLGSSSGFDLISTIHHDFPKPPPIIACSGMAEVQHEARSRGADLFLPKPIDFETLGQAIAALLAKREPSRALLEENAKRSLALREQQMNVAREVILTLAPVRHILERRAERDVRWAATFVGVGGVIMSLLRVDRLTVAVSSDPQRWPKHLEIEKELPLCRNVLETGSTFVVPDMAALLPQSDSVGAGHRFIAALPITYGEVPVGVVCLVDDQPRVLDPSDLALAQALCRLFSEMLRDPKGPSSQAPLIGREGFEIVVRTEFDRAARRGLTVHLFVFSSSTAPPELLAERTLVADLGSGHYGMIFTCGSSERAREHVTGAIRRLTSVRGFGAGDLFSIEMAALPRLDADFALRAAEKRLDQRLTSGDTRPVMHVVVREEALSGTPA